MISGMAMHDIEKLKADGLDPTPADIIRLNALALKVDFTQSPATFYELPRVAFLGNVAFREPTIGHDIWIDSVSRFCDTKDLSTYLAIRAFALSHKLEDLPDAEDKDAVVKAIEKFTKIEIRSFTVNQVRCAITYAISGADHTAREFPAPHSCDNEEEDEADEKTAEAIEDEALSVGAGVLFETLAMGLGVTVREILGFTLSKVRALQEAGLARNGIDLKKNRRNSRLGDYYVTRDEIRARLEKEKQDGR